MSPSTTGIRSLGAQVIQALQTKPQTSMDLAIVTGYSERHIRRVLPKIENITARKDGRRVLYSVAASQSSKGAYEKVATGSLPVEQSISSNQDTERDKKGALKKGKKGLSLSLCIVEVLRSEPDRPFVIRDLVDRTGGSYASVKRTLVRLSSSGKGSGPVRSVRHGLYQYSPEKEHENLQALVRVGPWKFENLTFVSFGAQGSAVSLSGIAPKQPKGTLPITNQPVCRPGFPYLVPTGQEITWECHDNGTQVIRFAANGAPPFSPDSILILIDQLRKQGFEADRWECVSMEVNVDSRKIRIDASYSFKLIEGVILKAYQHGYNARVEIADRRKVSAREVLELFQAVAGGVEGKETLSKVTALEKQVQRLEKTTNLALSIATKALDKTGKTAALAVGNVKRTSSKKAHEPTSFITAAQLKDQLASSSENQIIPVSGGDLL
jgi:hypothetical protein